MNLGISLIVAFVLPMLLPTGVDAQQPGKVYRIGYLSGVSEPAYRARREEFLRALAQQGWVTGRNLTMEYRYADGVIDALPKLAADLVDARVDLILAAAGTEALAAKQATSAIPIVFTTIGDPVEFGIVGNLTRPGGNITGLGGDLTIVEKRLGALRDVTPHATRYGVLVNPGNPVHPALIRGMETAATRLKLGLHQIPIRDPNGFDGAFATVKREGLGGVVLLGDPMFQTHGKQLIALATRTKVPMVLPSRHLVEEGGFMSFAVDVLDLQRRAAEVVDRILRGTPPGDIPVEEPRKFEMVINLKTAKALGLSIPRPVLLMADDVIQ